MMDQYKSGVHLHTPLEFMDKIDSHHEQFLAAIEPNTKAAYLRHMRGYAAEYLYIVPQTKKFTMKETHEVLANSVGGIVDFDPRDASDALENLAKYSHNLIEQPWRKEFHRIKLTSGFFIHNIRAHLMNAQDLLVTLNYAPVDDTTLELTSLPDLKQLKIFSRDCFLASQECLILSKLWEQFTAQVPDYPFSAVEAFQTRKEVVGDLNVALNFLLQNAHQRQQEERQKMLEIRRIRAEAQRIEDIQRQEARAHQERQRKAEEDLHKEQLRTEMKLRESARRHVPTDRLVDIDDHYKVPIPASGNDYHGGVRHYPGINSQIESNSDFHRDKSLDKTGSTEYQRQFVDRSPSGPSPSRPPNANVNANLKDLQDVAFDFHLNQGGSAYSDPRNSNSPSRSRNVEETLKKFEEKSNRVEEVQNRRSMNQSLKERSRSPSDPPSSKNPKEQGTFRQDLLDLSEAIESGHKYSPAGLVKDSSNSSPVSSTSSSGFKNLKPKQDFPKYSSLSLPGIFDESSSQIEIRRARGHGQDLHLYTPTHVQSQSGSDNSTSNGSHLRKSKVPEESVIPEGGEPMDLTPNSNFIYSNYSATLHEKGIEEKELNDILNLYGPNRETVSNSEEPWQWTCSKCTFKNSNSANEAICEMCDKSRDFVKEEIRMNSNSYASAAKASTSNGRSDGEVIHSMISGGSNKLNAPTTRSKSNLDKDYPSLPAPRPSTAAKFREGLGFPDENSNGRLNTSKSLPNGQKWTCIHCTYENSSDGKTCEMCTKRNPKR